MPVFAATWVPMRTFEDILLEKNEEGVAKITINRPHVRNAFRPETVQEMQQAFALCRDDETIGVIILTGAGDRAFCSGGDQKVRSEQGYRDGKGIARLNVLDLQKQIRSLPKPVIAMVAGYAIGGGHVLHIVCDLTIAADNAIFGQVGPKVGSFDGGLGSSYLARIVGQKKRERFGFFVGSTARKKHWIWDWSMRLFLLKPWRKRLSVGVKRCCNTHLLLCDV